MHISNANVQIRSASIEIDIYQAPYKLSVDRGAAAN